MLTRFSFDFAWWPSFSTHVNQFQIWLRNHQDKHFGQDSWWLLQKCDLQSVNNPLIWSGDLVFDSKWPSFKLDLEIIRTNILSTIHDACFINVTARVLTCFTLMWPGDLVFDPTWPNFKLDLEIIKTNILSMIHGDCFKNVTATVLTMFSADLAWWPSFWLQVTQFQTWPRTQANILSKIHDDCFKNVTAKV